MTDIRIEQGKWANGTTFWRIPKGTYMDNGDIIRVLNDESVIGMYVVSKVSRRDMTCQGCPFNKFMGSHNCLLSPNTEARPSYRRICDIPGTFTTVLRFTEIDTILEDL